MNISDGKPKVELEQSLQVDNKTNAESAIVQNGGVSNIGSEKEVPVLMQIPYRTGVEGPEAYRKPTEQEKKRQAEEHAEEIRQLKRQYALGQKFGGELPKIKSAKKLVEQNISIPSVVVAGLLHQGSKMVLGGGSKSFKTWGLCDLAISVANGVEWWGLKTIKGRVLYINFEIQEGFFGKRLESIITAKGLGNEALDGIDVWNLRGYCADLSLLMDTLLEEIQKDHYSLIVIDPIYKGMGKRDENAAGDINTLLNEIERMAVKTGGAVVFGAHFSKGNQAAKESIDRISGSGVFARDPDTILVMTQHENEYTYTVEPTLRNFGEMEPFCVRWNFPLMQRDDESDPKNLKQANNKGEKFTSHQLFEVLNVQELTTAEWEKQTCDHTGMKPRTFAVKKKELVDDKSIELIAGGKWKAVNPIYPIGWNAVREKEKEVQQTAIAPCCR